MARRHPWAGAARGERHTVLPPPPDRGDDARHSRRAARRCAVTIPTGGGDGALGIRESFLIIRLAGIGDVVMASALARRLREERRDARIVWLCGTTAGPLVEEF